MIDIMKEMMRHVRYLSEEIGHRPAGSRENKAAALYIEDIFQKTGLNIERQVFECLDWDHQETDLTAAGKSFDATANWHSPACDVNGPIEPLGTIKELEKANLLGKIAILYGELTEDEFVPKNSFVYYPPSHKKIHKLLDKKNPLAVITVSPLTQSIRHVFKDPLIKIPSATVMPDVGSDLQRLEGKTARLKIKCSHTMSHSWNIIGTRSGDRPERIVICAHYDTVWGSPGAFDNASGVSVLLTLAQVLAEKQLPIGLEFYAASGEEFNGKGTQLYLEKYGLKEFPFLWNKPVGEQSEVWKPILAVLNTDGVGLTAETNTVTTIAGSPSFSNLVEEIRRQKFPGVIHVDPWPASDHYTFYSHGVPSIAISCTEKSVIHHTPADTLDQLSLEKLAEVVRLEVELIEKLADRSSEWCRI